jgi:hypothetical protein
VNSRRLALAALLVAGHASAAEAECDPPSGISTCVDSNPLWLPAGRPRFVSIPDVAPASSIGLGFSYASRPIVLIAPSPDPEGREIRVVDDLLDATLLFSHIVGRELELSLAAPFVLYQSGAGPEAVTSQRGAPLSRNAVRDPRLGAKLKLAEDRKLGLGIAARADVTLPLGEEHLYAGEDSFVLAPSAGASHRAGRLFSAAEVGLRLRESARVADTRLGSELLLSAGAGVDVFERERLSFAVEAYVRPSLVTQPGGSTLIPAEWLGSIRTAPLSDRGWLFQLAGGTGLPLSSSEADTFFGLTTPRFRLLLAIRYAPAS